MSAFRVFKRMKAKKNSKEPQSSIVSDYGKRDAHVASHLDVGSASVRWMASQIAQYSTWRSKAVLLVRHDLLVLGSDQSVQNEDTKLYIYDTFTMKWSGAKLNGPGPQQSDYYASETSPLQDKIFVFWAKQRLTLSVLNFMANMQWDSPQCTGDAPQAVAGYSITRVGPLIYLFGGENLIGEQSNQIYSLHTDHYEWTHIKCSKEIPRPRCGHSASLIDDHRILFFGGKSGLDYLNDAYIFDTNTNTFEKVVFGGPLPPPRAFHSMAEHISKKDGKKTMVLFGGHDGGYLFNQISVLDVDTMIWFKVQTFGDAPTGRYSHFSGAVGSNIIFFGGQDNKDFFFDIFNLKVENISRKEVVAPDLSSKIINQVSQEEKETELGQHMINGNTTDLSAAPQPSTSTTDDPLLKEEKGLMDYLAQYQDNGVIPDFSPHNTPNKSAPEPLTTMQNTDALIALSPSNRNTSTTPQHQPALTSHVASPPQEPTDLGASLEKHAHTAPQNAAPANKPANLYVDTSRDSIPKSPAVSDAQDMVNYSTTTSHVTVENGTKVSQINEQEVMAATTITTEITEISSTQQSASKDESPSRITPISTAPAHRAPVRRNPPLAKMERQHSFTNKHILSLLENTPSTPTGSERAFSPLGKTGGTVVSAGRSPTPRSPSRSRRGSIVGGRVGSPIPRSSTPINFYGERTPPRSGTPTTVLEDDEDQAAQLQETFGDLSRLVAHKKLHHTQQGADDSGTISTDPNNVESGAAFEFNVSFGSFNFIADSSRSKIDPKSISTSSSLAEFCNTEAETIRNIFHHLCNPDEDLHEDFDEDGDAPPNDKLSVAEFLRLCKFCFMLENGISYVDVVNWLTEIMSPQQSGSVNTDDQITHETFRKIMLRIAIKKYGNVSDSSIVCFHHLVDKKLVPHYRQSLQISDTQLDVILTADSIVLMQEYDSKLRELFSLFSTLGLSSAHHPSWNTILKNHSSISIPELLQMAQNFDIVPYLIPRHLFSKIVQTATAKRRANVKNTQKGLNFPEFVEALFRVALYIYNKYPYSTMMKSTYAKVHALLDALGLNDRKKFNLFMKSAGVSVRNKYKYKTPSKKASKKRMDSILQDPDALRAELAHIFMYYCAFGDPLNLEQMSSAKFSKFVKDIQIEKHVNKEAAELIYVKMMKNRALRVGAEVSQQHHKMTLPYFMEALKLIAHRVYPKRNPKEALYKLLRDHVLAYASKEPRKFEHVNVLEQKTQELFSKHKKNLLALFHSYCTRDTLDSHNFGYMTIDAFVKFATQFDISPTLVHKKDVYRIYRSSLLNTTAEDIDYQHFEECIAKVAYLAYSKHPYDIKYKTLDQKIHGIFEKIGLLDWTTLRKVLEKFGHKVPYSPAKVFKNSTNGNISTLNELDLMDQSDYVELPPEEELDYELRCIFTYYSEFGNKYGRQHLGNQQYIRFCKDSQLYDFNFGQVDVDLVYVEITKSDQQKISYELFCDSLTILAERKYGSALGTTEALRKLLLVNILPHAQRKQIKEAVAHEQVDRDALQVVLANEIPLQKVFDTYKKLELVKGSSVQEMQMRDKEMSISEVLRFTQDFDICPMLLSVSEVSDVFKVSVEQESFVDDDAGLVFEQFLECVARIAMKAYSKRHFESLYHDSVQKAEALMERMDIDSAIRLSSKLRSVG
eukprot:CAMPEP_0117449934 /NCGR_PEP_ID=MMETSP0759-20121206/8203_1 /TAXON_ID=63605 /ORGANISM="Percolomonas cosmopolitus, Strain WS" /LENGTH=1658 /DNA_ID=CAMNT_0005242429 /DNA_START=134 /DNA_END=5107 /DNA_ORIENTATION=+